MLILAIDSSAAQASVCLMKDQTVLGEFYINTKQKHSRTLMVMVEKLLAYTGVELKDIELFAVTTGPGSFTGIRIGVSCVKGMAFPRNVPCVGVSTLLALTYAASHHDGLVCPVIDARCGQVYTALFRMSSSGPEQIVEDCVMPLEELSVRLREFNEPVLFIGDGTELCLKHPAFDTIEKTQLGNFIGTNHAVYAAIAALNLYNSGLYCSPANLSPVYLSMPQAQRERLKQLEEKK